MRWVFWVLLLLNVGLLVWRFGLGLPTRYQERPPAPPAEAPEAARSLRLLGEPEQAGAAAPAENRQLCRQVGPFTEAAAADAFLERLRALDVQAKKQSVSSRGGENYWVYLEAFPSRRAALQRLEILQKRNIDSYVIVEGELENGISLGMFSELVRAQTRLKEMIDEGLEARLKSVPRGSVQIWVVVEDEQVRKIGNAAWQRMLKEPFDLREKQNFCLDVAS